jgi:short-subunit dehydrogenase
MNTNIGKTALITGATSGIGAAYAQRLAADGFDLLITGRREAKINALADNLREKYQVEVEVFIIELSNAEEVDCFLSTIDSREIEILINNAGFGTTRFFHKESLDIQEKMVAAHILATMKLTHAILPGMINRASGIIINVSSLGAFLASPNTVTYSGTKAFLRAFSESLHLELMNTGVKVQVVCPGFTKTDMHTRLGIPEKHIINRGPVRWTTPEKVVAASMRCLSKNQVVCIPGFLTRLQVFLRYTFPASLYHAYAYRLFKGLGWIRE